MEAAMRIETKQLSEIKVAPYNPRSMSEAAYKGLQASLSRFGLVEPLVWNERSGQLVGGHQRLRVLQDSGATETEVVVVNLSPEDEKALNLTLNNPAVAGEFTDDVQDILRELQIDLGMEFVELRLDELSALEIPPDEIGGDTEAQMGDLEYKIIVHCSDEVHQRMMLEKLEREGLTCRALIS